MNIGKDMILSEMMHMIGATSVPGMEKYVIGQKLDEHQAKELVRLIAESVDFDMESAEARNEKFELGYPYRDFCAGILMLLVAVGVNDVNNWRLSLWFALSKFDRATMVAYAYNRFGLIL